MMYKLYKTLDGKDAVCLTHEDGRQTSFIFDSANPDYQAYQAYLAWLAEGNQPLPAYEEQQ